MLFEMSMQIIQNFIPLSGKTDKRDSNCHAHYKLLTPRKKANRMAKCKAETRGFLSFRFLRNRLEDILRIICKDLQLIKVGEYQSRWSSKGISVAQGAPDPRANREEGVNS